MKKIRYIEPIMRFNPGIQKYEPELPLLKDGKKVREKGIMWKLIWILVGISLMLVFFMLVSRSL